MRVQLAPALREGTNFVNVTSSFDAGHVSVAPELIYHSNCEWRMGTTGNQRKAAQTLPPFALHLVICAKAVPSVEKGDLVFWSSRWAKTTHHTPLWLSNEIAGEPTRMFGCMLVFRVEKSKAQCAALKMAWNGIKSVKIKKKVLCFHISPEDWSVELSILIIKY